MKNTIKFFGIIALVVVIGFSMVACGGGGGGGGGDDLDPGSLTLTGLGDYNNNYVFAMGEGDEVSLFAGSSINLKTYAMTGTKISSGSVTLKVWEVTDKNKLIGYDGSDAVEVAYLIIDKAAVDGKALFEALSELDFDDEDTIEALTELGVVAMGYVDATFNNGVVSVEIDEENLWDLSDT